MYTARAGCAEGFLLQEMAHSHRRRQWTQGPACDERGGLGLWLWRLECCAGRGAPWVPSRSAEDGTAASGRGRNATAACGLSLSIGHGQTAHVQRKCWCGHAREFRGSRGLSPTPALPLDVSAASGRSRTS